MGMAKKRIFNSQSIFFCQLGVINKLFVFRAFQDKFFLGGGGWGGREGICVQYSFLAFIFPFCRPFLQPVLLPTLLSFLCVEFWLVTFFQEKGKE